MGDAEFVFKAIQEFSWEVAEGAFPLLIEKLNDNRLQWTARTIVELNPMRYRGILCSSIMEFTNPQKLPIIASLMAIIDREYPQITILLVHRLVNRFQALLESNVNELGYVLILIANLIAHQVVHKNLGQEIMAELIAKNTRLKIDLSFVFWLASTLQWNSNNIAQIYNLCFACSAQDPNRTEVWCPSLLIRVKNTILHYYSESIRTDWTGSQHWITLRNEYADESHLDSFHMDDNFAVRHNTS